MFCMAVSGLQVSCSFRLGFRVKALGFGAQGFRAFGFEVQGFGVLALRWALRVHCVFRLLRSLTTRSTSSAQGAPSRGASYSDRLRGEGEKGSIEASWWGVAGCGLWDGVSRLSLQGCRDLGPSILGIGLWP